MRLNFCVWNKFSTYLLLLSLTWRELDLLDSNYLKKRRKYVIVIIFAVAALLTPPDPITQIGLGIPLLILYELSILSVKIYRKERKIMHDIKKIRERP